MRRFVSVGIALASALVISFSANAAETAQLKDRRLTINYFSPNSFYACSFAEGQVSDFLKLFDAKNIEVTCTGGLPWSQSLTVFTKFKSAAASTAEGAVAAEWKRVSFRGDQACDFNARVLRQLVTGFEIRDRARVGDGCWDSRGTYSIQADVLQIAE